jgi:hypothetical protein
LSDTKDAYDVEAAAGDNDEAEFDLVDLSEPAEVRSEQEAVTAEDVDDDDMVWTLQSIAPASSVDASTTATASSFNDSDSDVDEEPRAKPQPPKRPPPPSFVMLSNATSQSSLAPSVRSDELSLIASSSSFEDCLSSL